MNTIFKRCLSAVLVVILVHSVVLAGCVASAPETKQPTPTPVPIQTEQSTPKAEQPTSTPVPTQTERPAPKAAVLLVTGVGGLGDKGWNDMGWDGTQRAAGDFGLQADLIEPSEFAELEAQFAAAAESGKYSLIIGLGYECLGAIETLAPMFPDQKWLLIGTTFKEPPPNAVAVDFDTAEASFLMGVVAGLVTTNTSISNINPASKVGLILPADSEWARRRIHRPFEAGMKTVTRDAELLFAMSGGWTDQTGCKEAAFSLYDRGADVIWTISGGGNLGVFEAAKDRGLYAMGADVNQNILAPDHIIASSIKKVDVAVYSMIEQIVNGTFQGGQNVMMYVKDDALDVSMEGTNVPLGSRVAEAIEQYKESIVSGKLLVPHTAEELEAYLGSLQ